MGQPPESQFRFGQVTPLLARARGGSTSALGELLTACQAYLLLIANQEVRGDLRAKVGASDLVQETFVQAQRDFRAFRGQTEAELLGWLRGILVHQLLAARRRYAATDKRDCGREIPLDGMSSVLLAGAKPVKAPLSPSGQAILNEQAEALQCALDRLPDDYRDVLQLRYWQQLTFSQIGEQLGRTADAVRKTWFRAVERLEREYERPQPQR